LIFVSFIIIIIIITRLLLCLVNIFAMLVDL